MFVKVCRNADSRGTWEPPDPLALLHMCSGLTPWLVHVFIGCMSRSNTRCSHYSQTKSNMQNATWGRKNAPLTEHVCYYFLVRFYMLTFDTVLSLTNAASPDNLRDSLGECRKWEGLDERGKDWMNAHYKEQNFASYTECGGSVKISWKALPFTAIIQI